MAQSVTPATAAALASLQGLAAGISASAAAAAALNSPLNLTVGAGAGGGGGINACLPPICASGTHSAPCSPNALSASNVLAAAAAAAAASNNNNNKVMSHAGGCGSGQDNTGSTSPNSSSVQAQTMAQNTLANVLNSAAAAAAAAAAAGAAATASPPPSMPTPATSAQMPQLILASGQLVQGVQGAQLLIPTAQGK